MISATKLDEKMLEDSKPQKALEQPATENTDAEAETFEPGFVEGNTSQTTLFGGES